MSLSRPVGAVFIVAGTAIGGGILALPVISAGLGFFPMLLIMLITWFVMCASAILTIKVNLIIEPGASFLTMTDKSLGFIGKAVSTLSFLFLFYALLAAYISQAASFLEGYANHYISFHLPHAVFCLLSALLVIAILVLGVKTVDRINRLLFIVMVASFILIISFLLAPSKATTVFFHFNYSPVIALAVLPVVYTSFGFHGCTTPLVSYVGPNPRMLKLVFIIGSLVPLIAYIVWLIASLGVLSKGEIAFLSSHGTVNNLIKILSGTSENSMWFLSLINLFSGFAVLTSFLGVALGLFDYIYSAVCQGGALINRIFAGILTFAPPLLFALLYPNAFVAALGYAAIPLAFIATLLPLAMMYSLQRKGHQFTGSLLYWVCGLFSVLIIVCQFCVAWGVLPLLG